MSDDGDSGVFYPNPKPHCDKMLPMPTEHIIAMLRAERDKIDRALQALEGGVKRRGRPAGSGRKAASADYNDPTMPDWVKPKSALKKTAPKKKRRTVAQRKAQAERMKAFWAAKKKAAK
jgi:hypothetical protein